MPMTGECQSVSSMTHGRYSLTERKLTTHTHMSTQLLQIETAFLNQENVKSALSMSEFKSLQRTEMNAKKKKFETSLAISRIVTKGYEWYKGEGKSLLNESGIEWKADDFFLKVYGWQKSYAYKLLKASAIEEQVVEGFKTECDRIDAEGKEAERSIAALLKYAKDGSIGGDGDEEGGEGKPSVVATFTFKGEGGNVSVRIMSDGSIKTSNETADVLQSLSNFREMLMGYAPNTEETLEQVMDVEECEA